MANINPNKVLVLSGKRLDSVGMDKEFTAADLREWIAKACRFDKDAAGCDDIQEDRYSLRNEGRNPDGSGESYAERNT